MATSKAKNTKQTEVKKTVSAPAPVPKTLKIKMLSLYIGETLILKNGSVYELDRSLAQDLVKNGDAELC